MRQAILSGLILVAASLITACGEETKLAEPAGQAAEASALPSHATSARPASFALCMTCHSDVGGRNGLGPSLFGVVGRQAGAAPGYSYSPAMKNAKLVWDEAAIDRFLQNPRAIIPGTKMSFAGMNDAEKRTEIMRYLATLK